MVCGCCCSEVFFAILVLFIFFNAFYGEFYLQHAWTDFFLKTKDALARRGVETSPKLSSEAINIRIVEVQRTSTQVQRSAGESTARSILGVIFISRFIGS